jgi:hypothetical protein
MSGNENSRQVWQDVERVFDCIEEMFEEMTVDEIAEEARASGVDVRVAADSVRSAYARAYKEVKQSRLRAARAAYEREAKDLEGSSDDELPGTYDGQLALLARVNAARPGLLQGMTVGYRDFDRVAPEDLKSLLLQLARLGVLADIDRSEEPEE